MLRRTFAAVFKYDTVHGVYGGTVENDDKHLVVDGKKIKVWRAAQTATIDTIGAIW